jgi:hypothetical protein
LLARALALAAAAAADVEVVALAAAVAVAAVPTVISESSVAALAADQAMVVDSVDPQLLPMAVDSEAPLHRQLMAVVPHHMVAAADMAAADHTATHPGVAAASPGGKSLFDDASAPLFNLSPDLLREAGIKASYGYQLAHCFC